MTKPKLHQTEQFNRLVQTGVVTEETGYPVSIDYKLSIEDMVKVANYDWENNDITSKKFSLTGDGVVDVKLHLICLERSITTKEIEQYLDGLGLKPAKIEHMLAFGAKYPDKQLESPIVALGSDWPCPEGGRYVPCLVRCKGARDTFLYWEGPDNQWSDFFRFLAVSK